jgi:CRP-like cAMP-binding protein
MSSQIDLIFLLQMFQKISPLTESSRQAIEELASVVLIKKNQNLQPIGVVCRTIYFVQKGLARIYYYKDGTEITEYFAFENEMIIRAESLFTEKPSKKGIQALEDTSFIGIASAALFELFDRHPDLERLFRKLIESAYVETVNRIENIQFHTAEERYAQLIHANPAMIRRIPLKHIASYLGITQVSLSRIRAIR